MRQSGSKGLLGGRARRVDLEGGVVLESEPSGRVERALVGWRGRGGRGGLLEGEESLLGRHESRLI